MEAKAETLKISTTVDYKFQLVPPGNPRILNLKDYKERYFCLSLLPRRPWTCKWCFAKPVPGRTYRYCSQECNLSAQIYCYPQAFWSRDYLMHKQNRTCAHCPTVFKKTRDNRAEVDHIIPIFKGGSALGWDNHQLLCKTCHLKKTIAERKPDATVD